MVVIGYLFDVFWCPIHNSHRERWKQVEKALQSEQDHDVKEKMEKEFTKLKSEKEDLRKKEKELAKKEKVNCFG